MNAIIFGKSRIVRALILLLLFLACVSPVYADRLSVEPANLTMSVGEVEFLLVRGLTDFPEYSSSNPNVAQVTEDQYNSQSFRIEAMSEGVTTIEFILEDWGTGEKVTQTATCVVTVTAKNAVAVESIALEPNLIYLKPGEERQLNVKVMPQGANAGDVIVKSYDAAIIAVDENAIVKGLSAGYTELLAETRDGRIQAKSKVFVGGKAQLMSIMLESIWAKTKEFLAGESFRVKVDTGTCGVRG